MNNSQKTKFEEAYSLDCSKFIEKKETVKGRPGLSYLSWAYAWAHMRRIYNDASYEIVKYDGLPYKNDPEVGAIVYTRVTAGGETHEMWLPVMDGANKPMKSEPYTYKVKNFQTGKFEDKPVRAFDMFDINKTIMRCLTKNLAMFGIGLSIYAGEDIPQPLTDEEEKAVMEEIVEKQKTKLQTAARKKAATEPVPEPQPEQQLARVTLDMYMKGRCRSIIDFLADNINPETGEIMPEAQERVRSKYNWDPEAIQAVMNDAKNSHN